MKSFEKPPCHHTQLPASQRLTTSWMLYPFLPVNHFHVSRSHVKVKIVLPVFVIVAYRSQNAVCKLDILLILLTFFDQSNTSRTYVTHSTSISIPPPPTATFPNVESHSNAERSQVTLSSDFVKVWKELIAESPKLLRNLQGTRLQLILMSRNLCTKLVFFIGGSVGILLAFAFLRKF